MWHDKVTKKFKIGNSGQDFILIADDFIVLFYVW